MNWGTLPDRVRRHCASANSQARGSSMASGDGTARSNPVPLRSLLQNLYAPSRNRSNGSTQKPHVIAAAQSTRNTSSVRAPVAVSSR